MLKYSNDIMLQITLRSVQFRKQYATYVIYIHVHDRPECWEKPDAQNTLQYETYI
jgi:hypothetical protein